MVTRLGGPEWLELVGRAARSLGGERFHQDLMRLFSSVIAHDMAMVMRYPRFAPPDFLVCQHFSQDMRDLYLSGYYRFDPFYSYWREKRRCGVISLRAISPPDLARSDYRRVFQRTARISDELGIFLPNAGGSSIALFLERSRGRFTRAEEQRAAGIYPVAAGLHAAHIARIFSGLQSGGRAGGRAGAHEAARSMLLLDRNNQRVHANRSWRAAEGALPDLGAAVAALAGGRKNSVPLGDGRILHCETLAPDFPLAPGGRMLVIEAEGLSPRQPPALSDLARGLGAPLTAREREIVHLVLQGYPSRAIAGKLRIGLGTVKNHRRRLYQKLDITTERELFLLYLEAQHLETRRPGDPDRARE